MAERPDPEFLGRAAVLVVLSTLVLTASFLGVLGLVAGEVRLGARLPYYLLVMAGVFVGSVVFLESRDLGGDVVIATTASVSVVCFVLVTLAVEGVIYAVEHPEDVVTSRLLVYLLSAGLVATGVSYWGLRHWREYLGRPTGEL